MPRAHVHAPDFDALSSAAKEVMMQLFVFGPCWDGHVVSKQARTELVKAGYAERFNGWQQLTTKGLALAIDEGTISRVKQWDDKRWYKKATA